MNEHEGEPRKGDEYSHDDGTTEIVFMSEDGRVLTFREYPDAESFERTVAAAAYRGVNEDVASLPPASAFDSSDE